MYMYIVLTYDCMYTHGHIAYCIIFVLHCTVSVIMYAMLPFVSVCYYGITYDTLYIFMLIKIIKYVSRLRQIWYLKIVCIKYIKYSINAEQSSQFYYLFMTIPMHVLRKLPFKYIKRFPNIDRFFPFITKRGSSPVRGARSFPLLVS